MKRLLLVPVLILALLAAKGFADNPAEYFNAKSIFFRTEAGAGEAVMPSSPLPVTEGQWCRADTDFAFTVGNDAVATFGPSIGVLTNGSRFRLQATGTVYFSNEGKAVASMSELSYLRADVPEFFVWRSGDTMQFLSLATATTVRIRVCNP